MTDKHVWLAEKRRLLKHAHRYLEFYESEKARLTEAVARIEHLSKKGQIGVDEYDAVMHSISGGHDIGRLHAMYDEFIWGYKALKEDTLMSIDWIEKHIPEEFEEGIHDVLAKGSRKLHIMFFTFLFTVSLGLFIGIAKGKTVGMSILNTAIASPEYMLFIAGSGVVLVVFFILAEFTLKSKNI